MLEDIDINDYIKHYVAYVTD